MESVRAPTPGCLEALTEWVVDRVRAWNIAGNLHVPVGIALPGVIDPTTGVCVRCVNLPWLEGCSLADHFERRLGHRPGVMTDAQAATLAEHFAAGRPDERFAHLRLGTGIACCVICNGRLLPSDPARRTHWPVLVVDRSPGAPACSCGLRGCLERYAGGQALTEQVRSLGLNGLAELSRLGGAHPDVTALLDRTSLRVTAAIENLHREFAVELVALGGGVVTALPALFRLVQQHCKPLGLIVREAILGDDAGLIGAALATQIASLSG